MRYLFCFLLFFVGLAFIGLGIWLAEKSVDKFLIDPGVFISILGGVATIIAACITGMTFGYEEWQQKYKKSFVAGMLEAQMTEEELQQFLSSKKLLTSPGAVIEAYSYEIPQAYKDRMNANRPQ